MNKQLSFKMPVLDEEETKNEVEKVFEEYRMYLSQMPSDILPKVTASYSIVPPSVTNEFNSSTENIAIERVQYEMARDKFMNWVHRAVNRLPKRERQIIHMYYMEEEKGYDPDIMDEVRLGRTTYYKVKGKALLRLAFSLRKEVFKQKTQNEEVEIV
ncbi:ArpU family transcriptional regulator [Bacillus thuringiensis serovar andalousiensis]|uniref:ArpU family phage packaging/lysis transcriptional regulator n=1 Tax=Bacillus cereus group TaxID=86661 RepID=UPI0006AC07EC|nr:MULTISPECIES: ArpU family phage packaging/lysis transcriptional regulator [Bacillus cereus group]MEB8556497.1 ArpU family phage packaging/lysis transcriptional regulator [Bacillus cereus]MEB8727559.1 ArpU family phage packaging/lysis transcriptional regulator [Bacillus cereus]MEB8822787.1 ArpU family phage packaging/lysis transcriptional regulator [Bacillus cereus]MEB9511137.1 ArpU family phage packaging/lysis transcriptional regulator [Bacillus cereus]MEB9559299.1 ArpU family phage packagi